MQHKTDTLCGLAKYDNEAGVMPFKVACCAGHGGNGSTPGKRSPAGEYEWNFNNTVICAMMNELNTYEGVEILRLDDASGKTDVPLKDRTDKANVWGADLYVSVHHNANTGEWGNWTGVETYIHPAASRNSERLAQIVHPLIVHTMGLRDRGIKRKNLHIVGKTRCPAILTESGFMDSAIDIKRLRDDNVLRAQGMAIAQGIAEYAGLKRKAGTVTRQAAVTKGRFRIYTGVFKTDEEAEKQEQLIGKKLGYKPFAKEKRIWTGVFNTLESAMEAQRKISQEFGFNPQIREEK